MFASGSRQSPGQSGAKSGMKAIHRLVDGDGERGVTRPIETFEGEGDGNRGLSFGSVYRRRIFTTASEVNAKVGSQRPPITLSCCCSPAIRGVNTVMTMAGQMACSATSARGRPGDMEFARGNRAIRDHAAEGKDLLVFEMLGKAKEYDFWVPSFAIAGRTANLRTEMEKCAEQ